MKATERENEKFEKYEAMNEEMLSRTDSENAPWHIVEAVDRRFATVKIYSIAAETLERQIEAVEKRVSTAGIGQKMRRNQKTTVKRR